MCRSLKDSAVRWIALRPMNRLGLLCAPLRRFRTKLNCKPICGRSLTSATGASTFPTVRTVASMPAYVWSIGLSVAGNGARWAMSRSASLPIGLEPSGQAATALRLRWTNIPYRPRGLARGSRCVLPWAKKLSYALAGIGVGHRGKQTKIFSLRVLSPAVVGAQAGEAMFSASLPRAVIRLSIMSH